MNHSVSTYSVIRHTKSMQRSILEQVPLKLQPLARFGISALVLNPFVSCNGNARLAGKTAGAGEMRMYRLLRNQRLADTIMQAVQSKTICTSQTTMAIDFSNFGRVAVLAAAVQTLRGRAVPYAIDTMVSNTQGHHTLRKEHGIHKDNYREWKRIARGDQFDMVMRFVDHIDQSAAELPRLVFDRGFSNKRLLSYLFARKGNSYIRLLDTARVTIVVIGTKVSHVVRELPVGDYLVRWLGLTFRIVVTYTAQADTNKIRPWIIATNNTISSVKHIARLYYHRFEIEETFRDWQSVLGLRSIKLSRWQSLYCILAFASLAILLAWHCYTMLTRKIRANTLQKQKLIPKKKLSFVRSWQEAIQYTIRSHGIMRLQR